MPPDQSEILFAEKQRFTQKRLTFFLLIGMIGIHLYFIYQQLIRHIPVEYISLSDKEILESSTIILLVTIAFFLIRLDTLIKEDGIHVRFFPFQLHFQHILWHSLSKCYIRKYSAIWEYWGFGFRIGSFTRMGKAYTVSGKKGLQLEITNDQKLLIGTQKPEELSAVLEKWGQIKE
jgi:hypothetical protein